MKGLSLCDVANYCTMEALLMHRHNRDIWKAGIAIAGLLFVFVCMVWVPLSASAYEKLPGVTTAATPTVNVTATMAALQEDKLR
jgi:hypothetical protein